MAVDMFLELEGVKGESVDKVHKGKIDILSWNWGLSTPDVPSRQPAVARQGELHTTSRSPSTSDAASPTSCCSAANGKHSQGKIIVRRPVRTRLEYLHIDIEKVMVRAIARAAAAGRAPERKT